MLDMRMRLPALAALSAALFGVHGMPGRVSLTDTIGGQPNVIAMKPSAKGKRRGGQPGKTYRSRGTNYGLQGGQREALRAYRRAQGGPGIEFVQGAWVPRGVEKR
jgi:hypothetical protein